MKQRLFVVLIYALFFAFLGAITAQSWILQINNPAATPSNCIAVRGALRGTRQWGQEDHLYLDIYLRGNPMVFRVPTDSQGADFDVATFLNQSPIESKVTLQVRESLLRHPCYARHGTVPFVWASGLSDARTVYYSIAQAHDWDVENRRTGLYTAIAFTVLTLGCAIGLIAAKARGANLTHWAIGPPRPPRERIAIGRLQFGAGLLTILVMLPVQRALFPSQGHGLGALYMPINVAVFGFFRMVIAWFQWRRERQSDFHEHRTNLSS